MINDFIFHLFSYLCSTIKKHPIIMKNFIKGFRFTPSNYPAEVEAKIQKYRKQGYKLPPRKVLRTPEQLEGIRESAKINTALLDYISENIREGISTEEIDVMVYDFTTSTVPSPLLSTTKDFLKASAPVSMMWYATVFPAKQRYCKAEISSM